MIQPENTENRTLTRASYYHQERWRDQPTPSSSLHYYLFLEWIFGSDLGRSWFWNESWDCWLTLFTELLSTSDSGFQQPGSVRCLSDIPLFWIQGYNVKVIKRITMYYDMMTPIRHPLLFPSPDHEGLKTDNPGRANRKIIKRQLNLLSYWLWWRTQQPPTGRHLRDK